MQSYVMAVACVAVLSGCAIPTASTGVVPVGSNSYTISERFRPILGSVEGDQRSTLAKAEAFCTQQGRKAVPTANEAADPGPYGPEVYTLEFQCLLPNEAAAANVQAGQGSAATVGQQKR